MSTPAARLAEWTVKLHEDVRVDPNGAVRWEAMLYRNGTFAGVTYGPTRESALEKVKLIKERLAGEFPVDEWVTL